MIYPDEDYTKAFRLLALAGVVEMTFAKRSDLDQITVLVLDREYADGMRAFRPEMRIDGVELKVAVQP